MRRRIVWFLVLFLCAGILPRVFAQDQDDSLSPDEVQQIRDNEIHPNDRIHLYIKFMDQRLDEAKQLTNKAPGADRDAQIRDKLEEFTHLCDEIQDNIDTYNEAHADIRKSLKDMVAASEKWPQNLKALPGGDSLDFSRKTALAAAESAAEEARQLSTEQDAYFDAHRKMRNKNGSGPN